MNAAKMMTADGSTSSLFKKLGLAENNPGAFCGEWLGAGKLLQSVSPIDGQVLATVRTATPEEYERTVQRAREAFEKWQTISETRAPRFLPSPV